MTEREWHAWYKLADEAVGSWHRYVDAVENIGTALESIAEALENQKVKEALKPKGSAHNTPL